MISSLTEIYDRYAVNPALALHMKRVAAVAALLCDHMPVWMVDKESIVTAALLHDIGNVVREPNPALTRLYEPHWYDYRAPKHTAMRVQYGTDDHIATHTIVTELGLPSKIHTLIDAIDIFKAGTRDDDIEGMLLYYADNRVAPQWIVSLEQRFTEVAARGAYRLERLTLEQALQNVTHEADILFQYCSLKPEEITDAVIRL